ncbi:zf-TFIIB domain-containing protein [Roseisolibacter agri]|uniref:Transcription factor zinc-finger domain-containing protein n=1 Tax=Roseisolibacter agri TaxID=2014610 RepID=A0AA37VC73_9BACT|nr:zf-TFIIB domain-containing protein [Roseisolibacter agri]GLC27358.1 hypothetical protein rosag_38710 [Roseisolibacter agri]
MAIENKPSKNEDEYFARENAALIERLRAEADATRRQAERASHTMRCPRCGGHLQEKEQHRVKIDQCPDCGGVWFDKGELEIFDHVDRSGVRRFVADLFGIKY